MLPHELPAIKLSRLVQECIGAVPMPTLPVVVHAPAVARQFEAAPVDLKKHWSKAYNGALKIARECLVSAHNSQRMGYFSLGRNARIFFLVQFRPFLEFAYIGRYWKYQHTRRRWHVFCAVGYRKPRALISFLSKDIYLL